VTTHLLGTGRWGGGAQGKFETNGVLGGGGIVPEKKSASPHKKNQAEGRGHLPG